MYSGLCTASINLHSHTSFLEASTARLYIYEVLRKNGHPCVKDQHITFASRAQLSMYLHCCTIQEYYGKYFLGTYGTTRGARRFLFEIFDAVFKDGINFNWLLYMYAYAALVALKIMRSDDMPWVCMCVPAWVDEYILLHMKPRLLAENRWHIYAPLFNLV